MAPGAPTSERYAVARLTWDRGIEGYAWKNNGPAQILGRLALNRPFPDPASLLTTPEEWIGDGDGTRAAVVHSTQMGAHGIGAGRNVTPAFTDRSVASRRCPSSYAGSPP